MAKFLPFVNNNTPFHTIFNKVVAKFPSLPRVDRVQILNVIAAHGIEKLEEVAARATGAAGTFSANSNNVSVVINNVIRNLPCTPIKDEDIRVIEEFLKYVEMYHSMKDVFTSSTLEVGDKKFIAEFLLLIRNSSVFSEYCNLHKDYYKASISMKELFSDSGIPIKFTVASLKGYVLFFSNFPQFIEEFIKEPVKAILVGKAEEFPTNEVGTTAHGEPPWDIKEGS